MTEDDPSRAASPRASAEAWFTPGRFLLLLAAIIVARYPAVVLGKQTFFYRDFGLFGYPLAHYQRECFWRGEIPLWNPSNSCGLPFMAQWNTLTFYPPALFYLLFPLAWSLPVFNFAHLIFAGMGMYFLARRWTGSQIAACVAGMAFAFNGLSLQMLMWPNDIAGYGWMPWVVLAVELAWRDGGKNVAWATLAGAMQMMTGAPEVILLTWIFIGGLWAAQFCLGRLPRIQAVLRMLAVVSLVAGLAAVQLLPFIDLLAHSSRDANFTAAKWAMPAWGWANFFVPLFHCTPSIIGVFSQDAQQWTSSYYMGIGVAALALMSLLKPWRKLVLGLAIVVIASVVLAMGENAHIYGWLKKALPLISVMRYPIKFVVLTVFVLPLLAAFGVGRNVNTQPGKFSTQWKYAVVGIFVAIVVGLILLYAQRFPLSGESWGVTRESGLSRLLFLALMLGAAWLVQNSQTVRVVGMAGAALLLLVALDALTHAPDQNPTLPPVVYGPTGTRDVVQAREGKSRALLHPKLYHFLFNAATPDSLSYYVSLRRALFLDCNLLDEIPTASGFYSLNLRTVAPIELLLEDPAIPYPAPLADFVGGSQISSADTSFTWATRPNFMPFVTAGQAPIFADNLETLRRVGSVDFDPRGTVYLPEAARGAISATNKSSAQITNQKISAERVEFSVQADKPALVVIAQAFYHPWHAYVDGARVKIWPANGAFQVLEVGGGTHHVKLVYEDNAFRIGAVISLLSLCVAVWISFRKRRF